MVIFSENALKREVPATRERKSDQYWAITYGNGAKQSRQWVMGQWVNWVTFWRVTWVMGPYSWPTIVRLTP